MPAACAGERRFAIDPCRYPVGLRVQIRGKHAHSGEFGEVDRYEVIQIWPSRGAFPVVRLDSGQSCFVMNEWNLKKVN